MAIETLMHNTEPLGALLGDASDIIFDNGGTSLESTDVEGALKEINSAIPNVVDNLTSTSSTDALSAKQGKVLDDKLTVESIDISNMTWNKSIGSSYTWFEKMGKVINFQIYITESFTSNIVLASGLPVSVRPSKQKWFVIGSPMGGTKNARLSILYDGTIEILAGSETFGNGFVSGTYFV